MEAGEEKAAFEELAVSAQAGTELELAPAGVGEPVDSALAETEVEVEAAAALELKLEEMDAVVEGAEKLESVMEAGAGAAVQEQEQVQRSRFGVSLEEEVVVVLLQGLPLAVEEGQALDWAVQAAQILYVVRCGVCLLVFSVAAGEAEGRGRPCLIPKMLDSVLVGSVQTATHIYQHPE